MGAHVLCALLSVLLVVMAEERNTTEDSGAVCQYLMLPESNNAGPLPELPTPDAVTGNNAGLLPELPTPDPETGKPGAWELGAPVAEPEDVEEYRPTPAYEAVAWARGWGEGRRTTQDEYQNVNSMT
ncbi:uncharacterized protein LOC124551249 [Schistocerca americana]|uniref:uncharacterized protein LOC124551249 n=1 Tax=Schistocerca americana TaxID=7009 RepID=UPI001F5003F3|nr:uncharacterized protein LOC124551249 [Schistocerca americana]